MNITVSEIKKNLQETNSGGDEAKNQTNICSTRKKKAFNQNSKKEKRIQKMRID